MNTLNKEILVTKASGEEAFFDEEKLKDSLRHAGAKAESIERIIATVIQQLHPGISTKRIYKLAFQLLRKESKPMAARYQLKRAIMELGPSGFPFEQYVAELLNSQGYDTRIGIIVEGKCVTHEIDVIAEKDHYYIMIECKYHNLQGISCDVKIPLYINARFIDVAETWAKLPAHDKLVHQGWVFTNTKFTDDAIKYGLCAGLQLFGWNFPARNNLKAMIDSSCLYPITCLTSLTKSEKKWLLDKRIVLCKSLLGNEDLLRQANISANRRPQIWMEIKGLLEINGDR